MGQATMICHFQINHNEILQKNVCLHKNRLIKDHMKLLSLSLSLALQSSPFNFTTFFKEEVIKREKK